MFTLLQRVRKKAQRSFQALTLSKEFAPIRAMFRPTFSAVQALDRAKLFPRSDGPLVFYCHALLMFNMCTAPAPPLPGRRAGVGSQYTYMRFKELHEIPHA